MQPFLQTVEPLIFFCNSLVKGRFDTIFAFTTTQSCTVLSFYFQLLKCFMREMFFCFVFQPEIYVHARAGARSGRWGMIFCRPDSSLHPQHCAPHSQTAACAFQPSLWRSLVTNFGTTLSLRTPACCRHNLKVGVQLMQRSSPTRFAFTVP